MRRASPGWQRLQDNPRILFGACAPFSVTFLLPCASTVLPLTNEHPSASCLRGRVGEFVLRIRRCGGACCGLLRSSRVSTRDSLATRGLVEPVPAYDLRISHKHSFRRPSETQACCRCIRTSGQSVQAGMSDGSSCVQGCTRCARLYFGRFRLEVSSASLRLQGQCGLISCRT